jgi:hypothetical protein
MTRQAQNHLKNLLKLSKSKDKASIRYTTAMASALLFLGWQALIIYTHHIHPLSQR